VTVHGRALARNGQVTLIHDTITSNTCFKAGSGSGAGSSPPATDALAAVTTGDSGPGAVFLLVPFLLAFLVVLGRRSPKARPIR
jgi:hypothetical protein